MKGFWALICCLPLYSIGQTWISAADFPGTARDDAAAFSNNCKVYVGTGMEVGWSLTNDWWCYDMIQYSWYQVSSLPTTPRQYCTAQAIYGVGYLFGGIDVDGPLNELWAYNTATNTWEEMTPLPGAGRYAATSFHINGKFYVIGGLVEGGAALSELWEYTPTLDQWTQRTSLPGVPRHRSADMSSDVSGCVGLVIGGADENYAPLSEVWEYDQGTDQWIERTPLPEARYGLSANSRVQCIVMAGAVDNSTFRSDGYVYDPGTDTWFPTTDAFIPDGRRGGVMGDSDVCSGWHYSFYGLGLDGTGTRRKDWYYAGYGFGVNENSFTGLVFLPNPASDRIQVGGDLITTGSEAEIFDGAGQLVSTSVMISPTVDISELPAGSYMLRLKNMNSTLVGRFIKLP